MAKKTKLYANKVFDSSGFGATTAVLDGIAYVTNNRTQDCPLGSVVNISIGGYRRKITYDAVSFERGYTIRELMLRHRLQLLFDLASLSRCPPETRARMYKISRLAVCPACVQWARRQKMIPG